MQEIKTPHGHWLKFSYDDLTRIKEAEDDAGHWARYEYNGEGMLKSAVLSSGLERHYDYDGTLMTKITDEKGNLLLHNWYQSGLVTRQEFGNGAIYEYAYDWPPNRYCPDRVVVTLPDSKKREVSVVNSVPEFVKNYHKQ